VLSLILAMGALFTLLLIPDGLNPPQRGLFLAFLFGAYLGVAEVVSRYGDEPVFAILTQYGALYWFRNGMLGVWAFLVVWRFPEKFSIGFNPRSSAFLTAVLAGFGGAAVMRARFVPLKDSNGKSKRSDPTWCCARCLEWSTFRLIASVQSNGRCFF